MKNYLLEYTSLLYEVINNHAENCDNMVFAADDGTPHTVAEAKEDVIQQLAVIIEELQLFKQDVQTLPFNRLQAKYQ